ncbi:PD-(D/E)XK nuclease family protein [Kocuria rhizophila]|nr:PD-(D/E)XK nuclease family protein [Kocuria rhizophila]
MDLVALGRGEETGIAVEALDAPEPLTLRQLTGTRGADPPRGGRARTDREAAARLLHEFATAVHPGGGAAPEQWWGANPLTTEDALFDPEEAVRASPSKIETVHRSPLDWYVSKRGPRHGDHGPQARAGHTRARHRRAHAGRGRRGADRGTAPPVALLGMPEGWTGAQELDGAAETMLRKFAQTPGTMRTQHERAAGRGGGASRFSCAAPRGDALLTGRVDRLEVDAHGRHVVVDLKTGKHKPTKDDIPTCSGRQPGLLGRRRAGHAGQRPEPGPARHGPSERDRAAEGTVLTQPGGALLVQLGDATAEAWRPAAGPAGRGPPVGPELIAQAALLMAGTRSRGPPHRGAENGGHGRSCAVPWLCPLCAQGRQVTEK